jgi:hypothetical protein
MRKMGLSGTACEALIWRNKLMNQQLTARLAFLSVTVILIAGCSHGSQQSEFVQQICETEGSLYRINFESAAAVSKKEAVLSNQEKVHRLERYAIILRPTSRDVVFTPDAISFHGFSVNEFAVTYTDVSYLRYENTEANGMEMVIDYYDRQADDESDGKLIEQLIGDLSSDCRAGLQVYLDQQKITLATQG